MGTRARGAVMEERPILFSAPMVRAILAKKKTQTRRLVTVPWKGSSRALPYEPYWVDTDGNLFACDEYGDYHRAEDVLRPFGGAGDRLWVRETWTPAFRTNDCGVLFKADRNYLATGAEVPPVRGPLFNANMALAGDEMGLKWRQ